MRFQRLVFRSLGHTDGTSDRRWISKAPPPLKAWTAKRDFPTPPKQGFREWWKSRDRIEDQGEMN